MVVAATTPACAGLSAKALASEESVIGVGGLPIISSTVGAVFIGVGVPAVSTAEVGSEAGAGEVFRLYGIKNRSETKRKEYTIR